jgi:hypothetical protein
MDFRHGSKASGACLARTGVQAALKNMLEHSKSTMTARYAHLLPDDKIAPVRRLDFGGI